MLPTTYRRTLPTFGFFGNDLGRSLDRYLAEQTDQELIGSCPVDIREDASHIYVDAEMPGFKREEINVTLENGVLQISAQRKTESKAETVKHLTERRYNRIARSFTIQTKLDESKVEAKLEDGVLHLVLSKPEDVKPRKIEVK